MAQLIVALDVPSVQQAERLIDELYELDLIYKVGVEPLYGYGEQIFRLLESRDARVFVDAKLHDIPRTVAAAAAQLVRHGTSIINVHALGGRAMMQAAVRAAHDRAKEIGASPPLVLAVTVLTSMDESDLRDVGIVRGAQEQAVALARLARDSGCDGVVCSVAESAAIKASVGADFVTLTPGIRPNGTDGDDQKRVATPAQALAAGTDYLVVGRPITQDPQPLAAARAILAQMSERSE